MADFVTHDLRERTALSVPPILPLCTLADVQAELHHTLDQLTDLACQTRTVSEDRRLERKRILEHWRDRLQHQVDAMRAERS